MRLELLDKSNRSRRLWGLASLLVPFAAGCLAVAAPTSRDAPPRWRHLSSDDLRTAHMLWEDFDRTMQSPHKGMIWKDRLREFSRTGNSRRYYTLQLAFDPILTMYEVTGEESYLEYALELGENMVRAADRDRDGDGHPEWDAERTPEQRAANQGRYDLLLTDFQGACPLSRAARIVLTEPALESKFGDRARRLLNFVDRHILTKWLHDRGALRHWANPERWSDKLSFIVRMELDMFAITGEMKHRDIALEFARMLPERFTIYHPENDTYTWVRYGPDTAHCNREITMMLMCYQAGLVFDRRDIRRITNTFLKLIWDQSLKAPGFRNFHDGGNVPARGRGPYGWGFIYDGWIKLGQYDPRVQELGLIVWEQVKQKRFHLPGAKANSGHWAATAMPANLLRNLVNRSQTGNAQ